MIDPIFLSVEDVLELHFEQIEEFGGIHGVRAESLLESAAMTPQATFGGEYLHATIFEMAAAYAFHIAQNQPFLDGNKRTALTAALSFLKINGIGVLDPEQQLYAAMIDISNRSLNKHDLAKLLRELPTE